MVRTNKYIYISIHKKATTKGTGSNKNMLNTENARHLMEWSKENAAWENSGKRCWMYSENGKM